ELLAIGAESEARNPIFRVALEGDALSGSQVPDANGPVVAAPGKVFAVPAKGARVNLVRAPLELQGELPSRHGVPEFDFAGYVLQFIRLSCLGGPTTDESFSVRQVGHELGVAVMGLDGPRIAVQKSVQIMPLEAARIGLA